MPRLLRLSMLVSAVLLAVPAAHLAAQATYPQMKVAGRLQEQFYYFDNSDYAGTGPKSEFLLRRARIQVDGWLTDRIYLIVQPSFEDGSRRLRLRDAYVDVLLSRPGAKTTLALRAGQEKRPFGRYELTSSNNLPSIERGAGPGLVKASSNDLFGGNGFISHDIGAALRFQTKLDDTRGLFIQGGVYNGEGETKADVNASKSFGVRATVDVVPGLNVGGALFSHDGIVDVGGTPDSSFTNMAYGIDAQWGKVGDPGLYLVGDYMWGEDATAAKAGLRGLSLVGAWHIRMTRPDAWLYAVEPAVRFDFSDPDTDVSDNGTTIVTAGVNFYLSKNAQFRVAYERQGFQAPGAQAISGVRSAMTVHF